MKASGPLSDDTVIELAVATLINSIDLILDAVTLIEEKRFARAYSLAILAAEEWGKHSMWFDVATADPSDRKFWNRFWRDFRSHRPKLEKGAWMGHLTMAANQLREFELTEQATRIRGLLNQLAQMDLDKKLRGFYVDIIDGKVVTPRNANFLPDDEKQIAVDVDAILYQILWGASMWLNPEMPSAVARLAVTHAQIMRDKFEPAIRENFPVTDETDDAIRQGKLLFDEFFDMMKTSAPRIEALATKIRDALAVNVLPQLERLTEGIRDFGGSPASIESGNQTATPTGESAPTDERP